MLLTTKKHNLSSECVMDIREVCFVLLLQPVDEIMIMLNDADGICIFVVLLFQQKMCFSHHPFCNAHT